MSVGGMVVKVEQTDRQGVVCVHTKEREYRDVTAVHVKADGNEIQPGDKLWWQAGTCYWTRPGQFVEVPLKKVGYSFSPKVQP